MKNSITKKLTVRVAVLLLIVMIISSFAFYEVVYRLINEEMGNYSKAIVSIYADVLNEEAEGMHLPIDQKFAEATASYGDYICSWYRIDYAFIVSADAENGTIELLGIAQKEGSYDTPPIGSGVGEITPHTFSEDELALLNGGRLYLVDESDRFEDSQDTATAITDSYGNRIIVVAGVSMRQIKKTIWDKFLVAMLILLAVFSGIILALYFIVRKNVLRPANQISRSMTAYITDGKRSREKLDVTGEDEFAMIANAFNSMTDDIDDYVENIRELSSEQEHQQAEMDIAGKIQKSFLPPEKRSAADYEICAKMMPAKDIGGDLYDYLSLDDERTLITIADVSGKGMAAAMYMTVTLILVRQFAKMGQSPAEILQSTNNAISERNPRMMFATAFVGIYNRRTKILTYANAGHNLPYVLSDGIHVLDKAQNTLLGLYPDEEYTQAEIQLRTGDAIFLYTDGLNEASDSCGCFYGMKRLEDTLKAFHASREENLVEYMMQSVHEFASDAEQSDDLTMLALTVKHRTDLQLKPDVHEFAQIRQTILSSDLPRPLQLDLCVAAEEIFVNICSYAYEDCDAEGKTVQFSFAQYDRVTMRFEDSGKQYDPREAVADADEYDIDSRIGGLGKRIVFHIADNVDYEYRDGKNILTITKYLEEKQYDHYENK